MFRQHIENSGTSRSEWAERLGISQSYLSLLVQGKKAPALELAFAIERETGGEVPASSWLAASGDAA